MVKLASLHGRSMGRNVQNDLCPMGQSRKLPCLGVPRFSLINYWPPSRLTLSYPWEEEMEKTALKGQMSHTTPQHSPGAEAASSTLDVPSYPGFPSSVPSSCSGNLHSLHTHRSTPERGTVHRLGSWPHMFSLPPHRPSQRNQGVHC